MCCPPPGYEIDQPQPAALASIVTVVPSVLPSCGSGRSPSVTVMLSRFTLGCAAIHSAFAAAKAESSSAAVIDVASLVAAAAASVSPAAGVGAGATGGST